jgi:hypothetical protein
MVRGWARPTRQSFHKSQTSTCWIRACTVARLCVPKMDIKADGQDQKVAGSNYFNTRSVKVVDDHTVEFTDKKDGKTIYTETDTVSSDGNTLSQKFNDESEAQPVTGELTMKRVGKGPAGSHALSGSWRAEKIDLSKTGLTVTYQATADGLKMSSPQGESYDAKFDGKDYPINGDPGQTMVVLKKVNANTIEATYKRNGEGRWSGEHDSVVRWQDDARRLPRQGTRHDN